MLDRDITLHIFFRQILRALSTRVLETDFAQPLSVAEEEDVRSLFHQFTPSGEMDSKTFVKFCRDTKLLDKKFAATDADLIFQKTKAKASAPGAGAYSSGVVFGKRVKYDLFRAVTLPSIAEKKGMSIMDLIRFLASAPGPSLNGVTQQEAVRFHDDKSTYTGTHTTTG